MNVPRPENFIIEQDAAFKDKGGDKVLSPRRGLLSEEVNSLAASLDVTSPGNGNAYEPDAFLKAIQAKHDQLMEIKDRLTEQAVAQRDKARTLAEREAAVDFREKRVLAHEKLLGQTTGGRSWLGFFSRT